MRANNSVELLFAESGLSKANENVYDFGARQTEGGHLRRIKTLEHENALLTRMVSEVRIEISRLRKSLAAPR